MKITNNLIGKHIDIINYHLYGGSESFLYDLHEELNFNMDKFQILINSIKILKKNNSNPTDIGDYFIFNLFDRITYLYGILVDRYVHNNKYNIDIDLFYDYILELKYEILALFDKNIIEDYHGNQYC